MAHYQETGDLPPDWTEERDTDGRVFYSNHVSKSTTWDVSRAHLLAVSGEVFLLRKCYSRFSIQLSSCFERKLC